MSAPMTADGHTEWCREQARRERAGERDGKGTLFRYGDVELLIERIDALRARVGELSEDTARLGWCENYLWTARAEIRNDFAGLRYRKVTICCPNNPKGWEDVTAETLRDAIDYASERAALDAAREETANG